MTDPIITQDERRLVSSTLSTQQYADFERQVNAMEININDAALRDITPEHGEDEEDEE